MVVPHEMEEQFIRQKMRPLWRQKRAFFSLSSSNFKYWRVVTMDQLLLFYLFFFLQLKYCPTSFVTTLVLGFISLCYLKKIILIDKMNVDVFVAFKSYGSEWVK